jgi:hypothetical protein
MGPVSGSDARSDVPALAGDRSGGSAGTRAQRSVGVPELGREQLLGILESINEGVITADQTRVIDDGIGIRPADRGKSGAFGLVGMNERVRAVGGEMAVAGHPGTGTTITITVPASAGD